ncbi:MAG TPA: EAL domain-containing protein [Nitrospiria bacterium]
MTGLPNRNSLYERLRNAIRKDGGEGKPMALLLLDLERFKEVNDTFGHQLGDRLLGQVGRRIQKEIRDDDFVARLGGDEFAILLPWLRAIEDPDRVIHKIQKGLEPSFQLEGIPVAVEAGIGCALYPLDGQDADTLLRHADVAMYEAKKSGRGYARYLPEKDHYSPRRLALIGELRHAIENDELVLHYQPKIDLRTRRTIEVEGLVRWNHPHRGMIRPDEFIPTAERTGLIKPLTEWVINSAFQQGRDWHRMGLSLAMAVNVSVRNLQDPEFPGWLANRLKSSGLSPGDVRLEITESAIMIEPEETIEVLKRIKETGVKLSINDFGTGSTSLSLLEKMPVDGIKVDKSFVFKQAQGNGGSVFIRSMVDLAHHLGYTVVAEGVEHPEVLNQLVAMGCDEAQGYHMAKPMPADDLTMWLHESPWGLKGGG